MNANQTMKTTVVYHSADFDGIFCREIARKFLGDEGVQYIGWNFGDPPVFTNIPPFGDVYFFDLPVDRAMGFSFEDPISVINLFEDVERIKEFNKRLIWIDHHKSSIESHPTDIPGYRIDGVAACRLAWQWFSIMHDPNVPHGLPSKQDFIERVVSEPLAVRLAGEYDVTGPNANEEALNFQFGLRSTEISGDEEQLLTIGEFGDKLVSEISERGVAVRGYLDRAEALAAKSAFVVNFEGLKFLTTNGSRANCKAFSTMAEKLSCDAVMGFFYDGKSWTVSMYHAQHRKDLDLSLIAVKYGGGGHAGACGYVCEKLPFL